MHMHGKRITCMEALPSAAVKGSAPVRKVAGLAIIMASEPPISNKHDVVALRLEHRGCAVAFHAGGRS
jgi:hypothetical protein